MREGGRDGGQRQGGTRRETLFCRSLAAPASNSAFTASVALFFAAIISAVLPYCPRTRSVSAAPAHTPLRPRHTHLETSNTVHRMPSTLYPPLPHAATYGGMV